MKKPPKPFVARTCRHADKVQFRSGQWCPACGSLLLRPIVRGVRGKWRLPVNNYDTGFGSGSCIGAIASFAMGLGFARNRSPAVPPGVTKRGLFDPKKRKTLRSRS